MIDQLNTLRNSIRHNRPLIHCITNPISINDCANAVLAVGARPIMAEHPKEVADITRSASALCVNLGNITDVRLESIMISGKVARDNNIPCIIDLVGVACSKLRNDFAMDFIKECRPDVIKGNATEIRAIASREISSGGVDVISDDEITGDNLYKSITAFKKIALDTGALVLATGKTDIIAGVEKGFAVSNGNDMLPMVTGTGCMLGALTAAFISPGDIEKGTVLAAAYLGIAGEMAFTPMGTGTFRVNLIDKLSTINDAQFSKYARIKEV